MSATIARSGKKEKKLPAIDNPLDALSIMHALIASEKRKKKEM